MGRRGGERSLNTVQYLVAASREAGDVWWEDEGEHAHVAEDVLAEVLRIDVNVPARTPLQQKKRSIRGDIEKQKINRERVLNDL